MSAGGWGAAIAAVFTVIALLLQAWASSAPQRQKEKAADDKEKLREAIADGDAVVLGAAIDGVPSAPGDPAGLGTDEDTARRLAEITGGTGVAVVGPGDGQTARSGESLQQEGVAP